MQSLAYLVTKIDSRYFLFMYIPLLLILLHLAWIAFDAIIRYSTRIFQMSKSASSIAAIVLSAMIVSFSAAPWQVSKYEDPSIDESVAIFSLLSGMKDDVYVIIAAQPGEEMIYLQNKEGIEHVHINEGLIDRIQNEKRDVYLLKLNEYPDDQFEGWYGGAKDTFVENERLLDSRFSRNVTIQTGHVVLYSLRQIPKNNLNR